MKNNNALEDYKSQKGQKKIYDYLNNIVSAMESENKMKIIMSSTDNYISWLYNFMSNKSSFNDTNWDHLPYIMTDIDQKYAKCLSLFYEVIKDYAEKNYLSPTKNSSGYSFKIIYNGVGFNIGYIEGNKPVYYCELVRIDDIQLFIDYNNILQNKELNKTNYVRNCLANAKSYIYDAYNAGASVEILNSEINSLFQDIQKQEEVKKLIKKK